MANQVALTPQGAASASQTTPAVQVPKAFEAPVQKLPPPQEPDVRLVIQKSGDTGPYVYTVLDRVSGAVLVRIPHVEVVRLIDKDAYAAGTLFKTKV